MPPTPTPKPFLPGHYDTPIYRPLPDGDPARAPMAWPDLVTWIERTYSALPDPEADLDDLRTTGRSKRLALTIEQIHHDELTDKQWAHLIKRAPGRYEWWERGQRVDYDYRSYVIDGTAAAYDPRGNLAGLDADPAGETGFALDAAEVRALLREREKTGATVEDLVWGQVHAALEGQVVRATDRRRIAEAQAETCREAQYTAMRAAIAAGMSAYRVAQLTGMTQRAVHRIRDREIGAAATRE